MRHRTASGRPRPPGRRSSSGGSAPRSRRILSGQVSALAGLEAMVMDAEHGWGEPSTGPAPSSVGTSAVSTAPSRDSSLARPFDDRCRASSMVSVTGLIAGSSRWTGRSRLRHRTRRSVHAAPAQSLGGARFGPFRPREPGSQHRDHSMALQLVRGPPDSSVPRRMLSGNAGPADGTAPAGPRNGRPEETAQAEPTGSPVGQECELINQSVRSNRGSPRRIEGFCNPTASAPRSATASSDWELPQTTTPPRNRSFAGVFVCPAMSYSPTGSHLQYHRR